MLLTVAIFMISQAVGLDRNVRVSVKVDQVRYCAEGTSAAGTMRIYSRITIHNYAIPSLAVSRIPLVKYLSIYEQTRDGESKSANRHTLNVWQPETGGEVLRQQHILTRGEDRQVPFPYLAFAVSAEPHSGALRLASQYQLSGSVRLWNGRSDQNSPVDVEVVREFPFTFALVVDAHPKFEDCNGTEPKVLSLSGG